MTIEEGNEEMSKAYIPFSFCETLAATGPWHLRHAPTIERKLNGGLKVKTLCGLQPSWDTQGRVTMKTIMSESLGPGRTCMSCQNEFMRLLIQNLGGTDDYDFFKTMKIPIPEQDKTKP